MRAFAIALCLVSTPAMAADQFDLVCSANKVSERYRIDLARGEWCFGDCKFVQKIASVTSGMLVLAEHEPTYPGDSTSYNRINRVTGEWAWYNYDPRFIPAMDHRGACQPADYSGMPAAKF